jgi:cyclic beta-1,2-glucan synthetase
MESVERHLVDREAALIRLFAPPFDRTPRDPGYIKGYPPGVRENGGQYSHAAMWTILAMAGLGELDRAVELFGLVNPVNHARTPEAAARYRVEPYVVAADVYAMPPHVGRGGWTWYTGAAGWMYRAGLDAIIGLRREAGWLVLHPRLPSAWDRIELELALGGRRRVVRVERGADGAGGLLVSLDGQPVEPVEGALRWRLEEAPDWPEAAEPVPV